MVLQHLGTRRGSVFLPHGLGPDAPCHAAYDRVFRVDAVAEEEAEVGPKLVQVHATAQVVFDVGESIGERKGQLRDRVGTCLCNVIAADRNAVEVANRAVDERCLYIAHQAQGEFRGENAGVLGLIFFQDIGLDRTANLAHRLRLQALVVGRWENFIACATEQQEAESVVSFGQISLVNGALQASVFPFRSQHTFDLVFQSVFPDEFFAVLIDRGIQEESQKDGSRAIDGHGYAGGGSTQVEAAVEFLRIVQAAYADSAVSHLAIDVRASVGVAAIERDAVKGRGEALSGHALRDVVEALVRALGSAFSGKHAGRVFALSLERIDSCGVWKAAGQVFLQRPPGQIRPAAQPRHSDFRDVEVGQALRRGFNRNVPSSNLVGVYFRLIPSPEFWPLLEPLQHLGVHFELNFVAFRRDVGCIPL